MQQHETKVVHTIEQLQGEIASIDARIAIVHVNISGCRNYMSMNRFDRDAVKEAEEDIARLELELMDLNTRRKNIMDVLAQSHPTRKQILALENRMRQINESIKACHTFIKINSFDVKEVKEARKEIEEYEKQRADLAYRLHCLKSGVVPTELLLKNNIKLR